MNNPSALVSIIVPAYNVEAYLKDCVNSLLRQTYINIEIVIVNDGSTDSTGFIADNAASLDSRVKVIHTQNMGVSSARNMGLVSSRGEMICFVDGDDALYLDAIENIVSVMQTQSVDIVTCKLALVRKIKSEVFMETNFHTSKIKGSEAVRRLLYEDGVLNSPCAKLYRRSLIEHYRFSSDFSYGEDMFFNFIALQHSNFVALTDMVPYEYLQRRGSAMRSIFNEKRLDSYRAAKAMDRMIKEERQVDLENGIRNKIFTEAVAALANIPYKLRPTIALYAECIQAIGNIAHSVYKDPHATTKNHLFSILVHINIELLIALLKVKNVIRRYFA